MMHHIRPYKIFELVEGAIQERFATIPVPHRRGLGGISLLETFLMIAAARIVGARRFFEFGTFLGGTTLALALNSPDDAEVFTLDMDQESAKSALDIPQLPIVEIHLESKSYDFAGTPVAHKVRTLIGNSITFDFSPMKGRMDFIFVDGGHDLTTLRSDTLNAFDMVARDRPSCILWHDYGNPDYPELVQCLDELSAGMEIFHVEDTWLCVWFNDAATPAKQILSAPL